MEPLDEPGTIISARCRKIKQRKDNGPDYPQGRRVHVGIFG
jgi:hypothetical protein